MAAHLAVAGGPVVLDRYWNRISDRDPRGIALASRHYSASKNVNRHAGGFVGSGNFIALLTTGGDALFVWRRMNKRPENPRLKYDGIWCSIFRNEGQSRSSDMILEAEEWAWWKWPGETLHTFVDPASVASLNPGYCFKKAGWQRRKDIITIRGLHVLEKYPA
jgi:hypothetical protein